MEELIKFIIENLIDHPEEVCITNENSNYKVAVPKEEMGKVIGRQGRIARAIRTIVKASAGSGERVNIDIVEAD